MSANPTILVIDDERAQLRASEERYRTLLERIPDVVWCGTTRRTFDVSANAHTVTGFTAEEILVETVNVWFSRIHVDDVDAVKAAYDRFVVAGEALDIQYRYQHKNRSWLWLHARGIQPGSRAATAGACVLVSDITHRHRLEDQVRQAQKMEAIGMLSGGVAHDFNNILAVVMTNCDFLAESLGEQDPRCADVAEIRRAGERGANLTRQLLAFSRRQVLEPTVLDLNELVRDLQKMLRRVIGEHIRLNVTPGLDLGFVRADAGQVEQVMMNLVVNARDAIGARGTISIATANVELDEAFASTHIPIEPGSYIRLSVGDTGCGMDAATQRRIFEPFFTTKQERGTGLGLSTTYGIIKQSGGYIWVASEPGQGTTFDIYLPRLDVPSPSARPRAASTDLRGTETILLVEDDDPVRAGVTRLLASRGYHVLPARDGREALSITMSYDGRIHLVLSDVVMPGASGIEVVDSILAHSMSVKVLFMSGFTDHPILQNGEVPEGMSFIAKPFTAQALTKKVREVLDA